MKLSLKTFGLNNTALKIISLILGYLFWLVLIQNQKINTTIEVPLYFYGLKNNFEVVGPENIKIKMNSKRSDLTHSDKSELAAIHIDASKFETPGKFPVHLNENDIFLHNKIKLLDYNPSIFNIEIKEKK